ncbi:MAG: rhodanese-like domain-containing protein [Parvularculaceae bacterium]
MKRTLIIIASIGMSVCAATAQDSFGNPPNQQQQYPPQQQQQPGQQYPPQQQPQYPAQNPGGQMPPQVPGGQYPVGQMPPQGRGGQYPGQNPGMQPGQQPGMQPGQQMRPPDFSRVGPIENMDYGIPATAQLHAGAPHGPTPTKIPGGLMITTEALFMMINQKPGQVAIFDVLNGPELLPGAYTAGPAAAPGNFQDRTQQEFGQFLQKTTQGNKQKPLVFYCQSTQCWMSYNAALRAINMGYTQVLWYRGGIEAWKMAGLPTQPNQPQGMMNQQGGQQQGQQQRPY